MAFPTDYQCMKVIIGIEELWKNYATRGLISQVKHVKCISVFPLNCSYRSMSNMLLCEDLLITTCFKIFSIMTLGWTV